MNAILEQTQSYMFRLTLLVLVMFSVSISAVSDPDIPRVDFGFAGGVLEPFDDLTSETFNRDVFLQGHLGLYDPNSGWEIRGNLGYYNAPSQHPDDEGLGTELSLTPLTASLLYHIGHHGNFLVPYIGIGAGAYMYQVDSEVFGEIDRGTNFGIHGTLGIRANINESLYLNLEYNHHNVPKISFQNADNFNSGVLTFGIGFLFKTSDNEAQNERVYQGEPSDTLKDQIDSLHVEIIEMKNKRREMETFIEDFYTNSNYYVATGIQNALDRGYDLIGTQLRVQKKDSDKSILDGYITRVENDRYETRIQVKQGKWRSDIVIQKEPFRVTIGDEAQYEINEDNIDSIIRVELVQESDEFKAAYTKVSFYEKRLVDINKQIDKAQEEFRKLTEIYQKQESSRARYQPAQDSNTTIIHNNVSSFPRDHRPFRYYRPGFYVAPAPPVARSQIVRTMSADDAAQEQSRYLDKKREYIKRFKNR